MVVNYTFSVPKIKGKLVKIFYLYTDGMEYTFCKISTPWTLSLPIRYFSECAKKPGCIVDVKSKIKNEQSAYSHLVQKL